MDIPRTLYPEPQQQRFLLPYYTERSSTDWIEIRFTEVLMNYAECAAENGKLDEAYGVLKRIRQRAGIEAGSNGMYGLKANMSHDEMIAAIMLERKIEFAYEGKRYWDLRRRRMFASEMNGTRRHGLLPKLKISPVEFDKITTIISMPFPTSIWKPIPSWSKRKIGTTEHSIRMNKK